MRISKDYRNQIITAVLFSLLVIITFLVKFFLINTNIFDKFLFYQSILILVWIPIIFYNYKKINLIIKNFLIVLIGIYVLISFIYLMI